MSWSLPYNTLIRIFCNYLSLYSEDKASDTLLNELRLQVHNIPSTMEINTSSELYDDFVLHSGGLILPHPQDENMNNGFQSVINLRRHNGSIWAISGEALRMVLKEYYLFIGELWDEANDYSEYQRLRGSKSSEDPGTKHTFETIFQDNLGTRWPDEGFQLQIDIKHDAKMCITDTGLTVPFPVLPMLHEFPPTASPDTFKIFDFINPPPVPSLCIEPPCA